MKTEKNIDLMLNLVNQEAISRRLDDKIRQDDIEFISSGTSRFVPIKMTREEVLKTHECQKAMLSFMYVQYQKAIGTNKEEHMRKLYHDACIDYDEFVNEHREELL